METATKERLTGALLVVLALVIAIPELLSGRSDEKRGTPPAQNPEEGAPLQTYDVQLDGSASAASVQRDVPAAAVAEIAAVPPPVTTEAPPLPVPAAAPAAASTAPLVSAPAPAAVDAAPVVKPAVTAATANGTPPPGKPVAATEPSKEPAPAATGKWWVQLGSFASRDNAQQLARKLHAAGFNMDVSQSRSKGKELYRVRAGPAADRDAASALQARLAAAGEKNSSLVAP